MLHKGSGQDMLHSFGSRVVGLRKKLALLKGGIFIRSDEQVLMTTPRKIVGGAREMKKSVNSR